MLFEKDTLSANGQKESIMEAQEAYLRGLKQWPQDTENVPLEEMAEFFAKRLPFRFGIEGKRNYYSRRNGVTL